MDRGYQPEFSSIIATMYDVEQRTRKARTMQAVLKEHFSRPLSGLAALDVGASTGIIGSCLAPLFGDFTGIDIDGAAIAHAQNVYAGEKLRFELGDAMSMRFASSSFDVVICSQVYEHVPSAQQLVDEIFRVLKPGGVCYFAAGNRLMWNEPHYDLPLLSVLPRFLAHPYVRLLDRGRMYYERHFTCWGLSRITRKFKRHDYTRKIILDPGRYCAEYLLTPGSAKALLAGLIVKYAYWACPGYIWLLEKPAAAEQDLRN